METVSTVPPGCAPATWYALLAYAAVLRDIAERQIEREKQGDGERCCRLKGA